MTISGIMRTSFFTMLIFSVPRLIFATPVSKINIFTGVDYVGLLIEVENLSGMTSIEATIDDKGKVLWKGQKEIEVFEEAGHTYLKLLIENLKPQLWTPHTPNLYDLDLKISQNGGVVARERERLGFCSFESKGGQIYLNGKPIFLRGIAINPPGRGIPREVERSKAFAYDYVRFMKSINVNIIRIPDDEVWYDVCDELGMMVFGGNYSGSVAGKRPPEDYDAAIDWFKTRKFNKISHHPALMIYAITNETPYTGSKAQPWEDFTKFAHKELKNTWDSTRLYIGNAGYGYGKSGDICDLHRYWGWYYSSPFTFLNIRDNKSIIPFKKPVQPITFTECVGNYSGPDGRYNLTPNHKNPVSQLTWSGHAPQDIQAQLASEHQVFTFKQATELTRRLRVVNPELAGIFPFTILFHNWHTIENFTDMEPKEAAFQAKRSYAPVLLSWEIWTPNVYAGSRLPARYHVVNDADDFSDLSDASISYELLDASGKVFFSGLKKLPKLKYYDTYTEEIQIDLPKIMPTGSYKMQGTILSQGKVISTNSYDFFIANNTFSGRYVNHEKILVFDPSGDTEKGLEKLKIDFSKVSDLRKVSSEALLIIGKNAFQKEIAHGALRRYVNRGGRVLILSQGIPAFQSLDQLLPIRLKNVVMDIDDASYPPPERPSRNGFNINPELYDHAVFNGLKREHLKIWSDYTDWNEQKGGMPQIYPVMDGFVIGDSTRMETLSVLANYSIGLEGVALLEVFEGKGSYMVSGFDIVNRLGFDPIADRLMTNMINYMTEAEDHYEHPLITSPIFWGQYGTEKGLLTGIGSGFMINSKPYLTGPYNQKKLVLTSEGHLFAEKPGGWNNRPGIQYIPYGRRVFGPYYHRGFGGIPEAYNYETEGIAEFWCRVNENVTQMKTLVWNPFDEPLSVKTSVNNTIVTKEVPPNSEEWIDVNFKPIKNNHIIYQADRRMVFLETIFE